MQARRAWQQLGQQQRQAARQLQQMPAPAHRESDADIRRHIRTLLPNIVRRDEDRGFFSTLTEDEAVYQFDQQARRGAITGVALSCLPLQLNTMR